MNPAVDTTFEVDHLAPERKLRGVGLRHEPGGGGINVARAVSRLGERATALWTSGGVFGEFLFELLEREGVAQRPVSIRGMTRENFVAREQSTGRQYRFCLPGPALEPDEAARWLRTVAELDPKPAYLVISGSLPHGMRADFYADLVRSAGESTRVVVDGHGEALCRAVEVGVFLVKPNFAELEALAGERLHGDRDIENAARALVGDGRSEAVLVSLGSGGAVLVTADRMEHFRAPTVPIRSKVGAGDSMVAGVVVGLLRGLELRAAVGLGIAAGAAAVMTPGTELCRREDVERLFDQVAAGL